LPTDHRVFYAAKLFLFRLITNNNQSWYHTILLAFCFDDAGLLVSHQRQYWQLSPKFPSFLLKSPNEWKLKKPTFAAS